MTLPDTLTIDQAKQLAAQLGTSDFKFPDALSCDELVAQQLKLKEESDVLRVPQGQ